MKKRKIGRPPRSGKHGARNHRVSLRLTDTAKNAVCRLMQNENLNHSINDLLENIEENLIYVSNYEQKLLDEGLGIKDTIGYYSSIILNDLEEAKDNISKQSEELITMSNEHYNNVDNW
jgi:hypothetical protein